MYFPSAGTTTVEGIMFLTLASLLVAVEEIVSLLLGRPAEVEREDQERRGEGGEDQSVVVDAERLQSQGDRAGRVSAEVDASMMSSISSLGCEAAARRDSRSHATESTCTAREKQTGEW